MFNCILIFKALISLEEALLDNPIDIKAFHRSLGLPIDSVNLVSKNTLFLLKIIFCNFAAL